MYFFSPLVLLALAFLSPVLALPVGPQLPMIHEGAVQELFSIPGMERHLVALQALVDNDPNHNRNARNATVNYIEQQLRKYSDYWDIAVTPVVLHWRDETEVSSNACAKTKKGNQDQVLLYGGHHDAAESYNDAGTLSAPGINDNGSGVAALLELVEQLTHFETKNAVQVCFWAMEEGDSDGSWDFLIGLSQEDRDKIRLYFNIDTLGSTNFAYFVDDPMDGKMWIQPPTDPITGEYTYGDEGTFNFAVGSSQASSYMQSYFESQGLNHTQSQPELTDADAFVYHGIPVTGLKTGSGDYKTKEEAALFGGQAGEPYDAYYHDVGDTIDNVNLEVLLVMGKAMAAAAEHWGISFEDLAGRQA